MQCEFSKSELYDLNSAVEGERIECERAVSRGEELLRLRVYIERLKALHVKLAELLSEPLPTPPQ